MIFERDGFLLTPYKPLWGAAEKNDAILDACVAHPDRFMVSACSGDPRLAVASLLTDPDNAAWEVWRGASFSGIIVLDRIVPHVDARLQLVFLDDELASKATLLGEFVERCFSELGLHRVTFEAPANMTTLISFVRRKLSFVPEGKRVSAYHDGTQWRDVAVLSRFAAGGNC